MRLQMYSSLARSTTNMPKRLNIIYDGHCGFCIRSLNVVRKFDVRDALSFHDSHSPATLAEFPELRDADLADAMYTIVAGECPYRGFFSFRRILWASPLLWPLLPLFYFPGVSVAGDRVYAWIAGHRKNFGCASDFCELPGGATDLRVPRG
jgi:predicted DCC family thiol-disulfide oxidoreductase YuxK